MYKTLNRLEEAGYISAVKSGKEKIYSITDHGLLELNNLSSEWEHTKTVIDAYDHLSDTVIGNRIIHLKETTSTNDEIKDYLSKENDGLIIHTDYQSRGRGRLNRVWEADSNTSIMMSSLLFPDISINEVGLLTQVAAAAIFDTLTFYGVEDLSIKWPNDIMIGLQKVAGVLVESKLINNKVSYIIIGIGLNVELSNFDEELLYKATALNEHVDVPLRKEEILKRLIKNLNKHYHHFLNKNYDFLTICRTHSFLIGKYVSLNMDEEEIVEVVGINDSGALLINRDGMVESVLLNEVSLSSIYGGNNNE
jgi:BirA family biotin operon repressor/biotin-[acetyl-CoA-carboxylase] ligase